MNNKPYFDLREQLFRMTGTDLALIDGIDFLPAMMVISEAEWDMSKWQSEDHFVAGCGFVRTTESVAVE